MNLLINWNVLREDIKRRQKVRIRMTRFSMFTDEELDAMESAFCSEGLTYLVDEVRIERRYREGRK